MSRRALHLVGLFLLLTVIGTAESAPLRNGVPPFAAPYIVALLHARQNARMARTAFPETPDQEAEVDRDNVRALPRVANSVSQPLAAALLTHAVTGSSL